jgi:RNA polymerase sigma-70 factor (ECF subfamily)
VDEFGPTFEDVFRHEYPAIVRAVAPIVGGVADAEGLAQEAFLKAFVRWRRLRHYDHPVAWIRRVAIRDAVRAAGRRPRASSVPTTALDPGDRIAQGADLTRALATLSPKQRAAVVLYHLVDWPTTDVAEAMGCSEATVRVHLHRGRTALAVTLGTDVEEVGDGR